MTRRTGTTLVATILACTLPARGDTPPASFQGEWRTSIGTVKLSQAGDAVTGTYGNSGQFSLKGAVRGKVLTFEYQEGNLKGDGRFALEPSGHAFTGTFQIRGGRQGVWNGWRPDPDAAATAGAPGPVEGQWLTEFGLMELTRDGAGVTGRYAVRGTSSLKGELTGRRLDFRFEAFRPGAGWFDLAKDRSTLAGAAHADGFGAWFGWHGRPAPEFVRHVRLVAGQIVDGSTRDLLTYAARAPEGYREDAGQKWPTLVLLHGSSMDGRSYVSTVAAAWPDLARDFLLVGINGETCSDIGRAGEGTAGPRFNYSYVNYVGRSTYKGFPGTDRESPALVAAALAELKGVYPVDHYLLGGHSQGGFLAYSLLMNDPEALAGVFSASAGVIFQCEPDAFADEALRKAQRAVPLAVIHGRNDPVVGFASGESAANLFLEAGWPAFRFFTDERAGHMFARLPIPAAVRWLESLASRDPAVLLEFAASRQKENAPRDVLAALRRARALELTPEQKARADGLTREVEANAAEGAKDLLPRVRENRDGSWVDAYLAYRDEYGQADAARELNAAFDALRAKHTAPAREAFAEARKAFQQGKKDEGAAKYREIAEKYYASPFYRNVKRWLATQATAK